MGKKKREGYSWYEYMGLEQACGDNYKYILEKEREKYKRILQNVRAFYLSKLVGEGYDKDIDSTAADYSK